MYICYMKQTQIHQQKRRPEISLPIIYELNHLGEKLCIPTLEKVKDGLIVEWNYQKTSFACQGEWAKYLAWYSFEDYDFDKAMQRLTDFIRSEYREVLNKSKRVEK